MRILVNGELAQRIKDDPRWSEAQREAAAKAAAVDPDARCIGLDARMRPVLTVKLAQTTPSQYAVLRNGAPAAPRKPFAEYWRQPRHTPTHDTGSAA